MKQIRVCWLWLVVLTGMGGVCANATGDGDMIDKKSKKTICVGRLLMDVPQNSKVSIGATYQNAEVSLVGYVRDFNILKSDIDRRAKSLGSEEMSEAGISEELRRKLEGNPLITTGKNRLIAEEVGPDKSSIVLGYHVDQWKSDMIVELHKVIDGKHFVFSSKDAGSSRYPLMRDGLLDTASNFSYVPPNKIPTEIGFCAGQGIYKDDGKLHYNESLIVVITFSNRPDIQFSIDANAIHEVNADEPSLKHRVDGDLSMMRSQYSGIDVIERGALEVAGQRGYQVAIGAPYDNVPGTRIRKFFWSADGVPNDVTRPFMEVDMTVQPTDDGQSTIKDDAEAKALWEQLIHSLRIRPGAV